MCDKATPGSSPCVASSQRKERDAAHADCPCPAVHDSIVARWNVLWCPDFYFSGGLFLRAWMGCFFWGSHAALQTGSDLWPRYAVLSTCVPWCPRLSAPVRICPSAMGGHAPVASVHLLCRVACPALQIPGVAALPTEGVSFLGVPCRGASLWSGSLFRFRPAGPGTGTAALNAAIKIGFTSGRSDPRLLKWALIRGCKFRKEKPGLISGCKIGSRFRRTSPRCYFSSRLTRALRGLFLPFNFEG